MTTLTIDSFQCLLTQWTNDFDRIRNILAVVGVIYISKKTLELIIPLLGSISTHVYSRLWPKDLKNYGSWAVVTGPTEGIGKAFAIELAKRGLHILLLGRNTDKLRNVADSIEKEYGVKTMIHIIDFNSPGESYEDIDKLLGTLNISIFVNNAGVINKCPSFIYELSEDDVQAMVNVNVKSLTVMTKLAVSHMRAKKEDYRGIVVNVSSLASLAPAPLLSVYAATKAYVTSFSRAVHDEVRKEGITVQTLIPSYVKTKMVGYSPYLYESWFVPSPEIYVRHALYTVGYSTYTTGYWMHGLQEFFVSLCPHFIWMYMARNGNMNFRQQYYSRHED